MTSYLLYFALLESYFKSLNSTLNTIINFDSLYSDNPPFIELINLNETNIDLEFTNFKNSINNKISKLTNIVDLNTVLLNTHF